MNYKKIKSFLIKIPIVIRIYNVFITGTIFTTPLPQKQKAILLIEYAKKFNCKVFIETGTYKGDTLFTCRNFFEHLYSIELSHELFVFSKSRFSTDKKIDVFEGNSKMILPQLIERQHDKCILFWLDAHYSGGETAKGHEDSPITKELDFILNNKNLHYCILIDDARCFNGKNGYPKIYKIKKMIKEKNKKNNINLKLQVKNDIIRITKKI